MAKITLVSEQFYDVPPVCGQFAVTVIVLVRCTRSGTCCAGCEKSTPVKLVPNWNDVNPLLCRLQGESIRKIFLSSDIEIELEIARHIAEQSFYN